MSIDTIIQALEYMCDLRRKSVPKDEAIKLTARQYQLPASRLKRFL